MAYIEHDFYCLQCGNRGIPIRRSEGKKKEKFHRKKLYCIHCHEEVNHIECKTPDEIEEFKLNFANGVYKDEAEKSISHVRQTRIG
jgi:hypothetical protein